MKDFLKEEIKMPSGLQMFRKSDKLLYHFPEDKIYHDTNNIKSGFSINSMCRNVHITAATSKELLNNLESFSNTKHGDKLCPSCVAKAYIEKKINIS